jgi:hypothetical protein
MTWKAPDTLAHGLVRGDFPRERAEPALRRLEDGLRCGVAYGWARHGEGDTRYSLDPDRVSGETGHIAAPRMGFRYAFPAHSVTGVSLRRAVG